MEEDEESRPKTKKQTIRKLTSSEIAMINDPETWDDSMETTMVWDVINKNNMKMFREMLIENPELAHIRSKDGRGPIWWAHEYGRVNFVTLLKKLGVSDTKLKDVNGVTPISLTTIPKDKQK
jgi:dolichyl-diphosphooligosaccharide---protein glycosyltransferase